MFVIAEYRGTDTAKERDIHVVLVAMPITDINRNLLSDQSWNLYRSRLRDLAARHQETTTFFDMQETKAFNISDFQDTVHLHSGGGAKLLDMIAKIMAQDKASMAALAPTKGDIADNQAFDRFRQTTRQEAMVEQKESSPL